jgi:hypothetical protein
MDYIDERAKQNDPIKILGFDSQEGSIFKIILWMIHKII